MGKAKAAPEKPKKEKKVKDKDAPKKPLSTYMVFANKRRPDLAKKNPTLKITDLSKLIGEEWRALDAAQKAPYDKEAEQLKAKYVKEVAEYEKKKAKA